MEVGAMKAPTVILVVVNGQLYTANAVALVERTVLVAATNIVIAKVGIVTGNGGEGIATSKSI